MKANFHGRVKSMSMKAPREQGQDPVMVLTIELDATSAQIASVARFLGKVPEINLFDPQLGFDDAIEDVQALVRRQLES